MAGLNLGELYVQIGANTDALGSATKAIASLTSMMEKLERSVVGLNGTMQQIYSGIAIASEKSSSRQIKSAESAASAIEKSQSRVKAAIESQQAIVDRHINSFTKFENSLSNVGSKADGASRHLSAMTSRSRSLSLGVQNAAYQIQDMAVQFEMGIPAARVFGQQLPQLLGSFGVMGTVAGAVVAGLALFIPKLMDSGDAAEEAKNKVDHYKNSIDELKKITDEYVESQAKWNESLNAFKLKEFNDTIREAAKKGDKNGMVEAIRRRDEAQKLLDNTTLGNIESDIRLDKTLLALQEKLKKGTISQFEYNVESKLAQEIEKQGLQGKKYLIDRLREELTLKERIAETQKKGRVNNKESKIPPITEKVTLANVKMDFSNKLLEQTASPVVQSLEQIKEAYERAKEKIEVDSLFAKVDLGAPKAKEDLIALYKALGIDVPEALLKSTTSAKDLSDALKALNGEGGSKVAEAFAGARNAETISAFTTEVNDLKLKVNDLNSLTPTQNFLGFFDSSVIDNAIKLKEETRQTEDVLTKLEKADPKGIEKMGNTIKSLADSRGIDLGSDFDPKKAESVAKGFVKVQTEIEKTKNFGKALGDSLGFIGNQISNVISTMSQMYEQQAAYHAQMAQEALSYGKSQSEIYMQLADAVHYSNNAQAKSFEQRAIAAAESAAKQYDAEQKARAKANAEAKKMFEIQKKLQIAQVIMSTAVAAMRAFSDLGPIVGAPVAAAMGALGAYQVALISQQQFTPREKGGSITGGKPYLVGERGPELIIPGQGGTVVNNKDLMSGIGGGDMNIIFQISANDASGFDRLLNSRRGMIINMIREATNNQMRSSPV